MVVGIDLTEYSEIVLEHSLDQAARHEAPEMHFLYVKEDKKRATEEMKQRLSAIVFPALQTFNQYGTNWRARLHVRAGKPDQEIAMLAADVRADLIVIGQFGLHNKTEKYKTVPGRVLNAAPCPTLVVGMPQPLHDLDQCAYCAAIRDDSDGERWFCDGHTEPRKAEHTVTPMTVWSGGSLLL